ncbi:MAG TPA: glutamyl-tRNA reductase [Thermoleophilaceae bacterium]|nr:glutamyl-tRNA reductase [Thermoleophilaceae bacterium]
MSAGGPHLAAVGLSHRTAPVAQREKAALDSEGVRGLLRRLMRDPRVAEAAAVSTCNRTEVYVVSDDPEHARTAGAGALVACSRISAPELACAHYALYEEAAAGHLFRLTGGLDSMVLGESEVQGQVKAAAALAAEEGALGPLLDGLFRQAVAAGARLRRETRISDGPMSVSSVAVDIARRAFPDLASRRVLLVGAGRMAESTGMALRRRGAGDIVVLNRTLSAARALASCLGARAAELGALAEELPEADMVVCSTDAPHPIVTRAHVEAALSPRPERPLVLIDLAVPRDVEPEVSGVPGAILYDIDDLDRNIKASLDGRRRELASAEAIVAEEVVRFRGWRNGLAVAPVVDALYSHVEDLRRAELARAGGKLDRAQRELLDAFSRSLVTKLLHDPAARLRGHGSLRHAEAIRELFGLDHERGGDVVELRAAS